ncbi:MAG: hypothetical protein ABSH03_19520 [Candidatus Lustribacter sp.]|jgi:hypothetical protein
MIKLSLVPLIALVLVTAFSRIAAGAVIYHFIAHDGQFLGDSTCTGSRAIGNPFSQYGSRFSSVSIWNKFSQYGSEFSALSPYNRFTSTPPVIYDDNDNKVGYLTLNQFVGVASQNISPIKLELIMMDECDKEGNYR